MEQPTSWNWRNGKKRRTSEEFELYSYLRISGHFACFSAWAKKTDLDQEVTKVVVEEEKEEIPIIPYSSLFILSSENK